MKKIMLIVAVLATVSISLFAFTKSKTPAASQKPNVQEYVWIKWGCGAYGSPNPNLGYYITYDPNMLVGNCPTPGTTGICALQFLREDVECANGLAYPKASAWSTYRMIKYCPN